MFRSDLKEFVREKSGGRSSFWELKCQRHFWRALFSTSVSGFSAFWQCEQHGIFLSQVTSRVCKQNGQRPDHS